MVKRASQGFLSLMLVVELTATAFLVVQGFAVLVFTVIFRTLIHKVLKNTYISDHNVPGYLLCWIPANTAPDIDVILHMTRQAGVMRRSPCV